MLSGTTGSWVFTTLSDAREGKGVDIYYDKLFVFGLPTPDENEFEWSNEGDPAVGYVPEDQVWEFAQRDAGKIVTMVPLNEAMGIFKENSSTWLHGSVDEEFQATAVREGLSETEGCVALHSAIVVDGDIYLLSRDGPRIVSGGRWVRVNEQGGFNVVEDFWRGVNKATWSNAFAWVDLSRRLVVWMVPTGVSSEINTGLVYAIDSQSWSVFTWKPSEFVFSAAAAVEDDDEDDFVLMGTTDGRVFKYGTSKVDDDDVAIERIVRSRPYGRSTPTVIKRLVEVNLMLNLTTDLVAQMRPIKMGDTQLGKSFGLENKTGRYRYRRGFNEVGYDVGWEFYMNEPGQEVAIESAVTVISVVGVYPSL
jgi:hypothetical protein